MADHQSSRLTAVLLVSLLCSLLSGCEEQQYQGVRAQDSISLERAFASWQQGKVEPMNRTMSQLVEATGLFLESPSDQNRLAWQSAWITAHDSFLAASTLHSPESYSRIDAWPMEPGFLDSLPDYPGSGIVSDSTLDITSSSLTEQHQITDESEVALGFHVLEYYAFERDIKSFGRDATNYQKRHQLIQLVATLLERDIASFSRSQEMEPGAAQASYALLLLKIQRRLDFAFSEFNLLGEHSPASKRSSQNISIQLGAIAELLDEPVSLNHYLIELNPAAAKTFNETLLEAQMLLPVTGQPDEATSARLVLLISSLSQQMEDFVAILPVEGEI